MCTIVDANIMGEFLTSGNEDAAPVHRWLEGGGTILYSTDGPFDREIGQRARDRLLVYSRSGRARRVRLHEFEDEKLALLKRTDLVSNDAHALALAREKGARILYTADKNLMKDFKNPQIIRQPRSAHATQMFA